MRVLEEWPPHEDFEEEEAFFDDCLDDIDPAFIGDYCELHPGETEEEWHDHEDYERD